MDFLRGSNSSEDAASQSRLAKLRPLTSNQIYKIGPNSKTPNMNNNPPADDDDKHFIKNWGLPLQVVNHYSKKKITELFHWQVEALERPGVIAENGNLVFSAPTSAGKTMVSDILLYKNVLERQKKAIIILPFVSMTYEKVENLNGALSTMNIRIDKFSGNSNPNGGFSGVDIAVCTIEKANNIINKLIEEGDLADVGLIIVDEIHMIGDKSRGYLLEPLLTKILFHSRKVSNPDNRLQIVSMSATVPNLNEIASWLDAKLYVTEFRPVPLYERLVTIAPNNPMARVEQLDNTDRTQHKKFKTETSMDISNLDIEQENGALVYTALETIIEGNSALIFCPTKAVCETLSREIAKYIFKFGSKKITQNERSAKMCSEIGDKIRPHFAGIVKIIKHLEQSPAGLDPVIQETIRYSVAFHHAGMSMEERIIVEKAFRAGDVKILCSTTTLAVGVNLPARRVLISSPLSWNRGLIDAITYHQMIGRAGRKGFDVIGEAYTFCKAADYERAKRLICSKIPPIKSCLMTLESVPDGSKEEARPNAPENIQIEMTEYFSKAMIEAISIGLANNKKDLIEYCKCTFFFIQNFTSQFTENEQEFEIKLERPIEQVFRYLQARQLVHLQANPDSTEIISKQVFITGAGKAIALSGLLPEEGLFILKELELAYNDFHVVNDLHLIYFVTPTYVSKQLYDIDWNHYWNIYKKLKPDELKVSERIGLNTGHFVAMINPIINQVDHKKDKLIATLQRFYASLALYDLIQEQTLAEVTKKYLLSKGQVQSLQQQSSTFAGMLSAFCTRLGWNSMAILVNKFQPRLFFGIQPELVDLMRINFLPKSIARSLYRRYKTLEEMATANIDEIAHTIFNGFPCEEIEGFTLEDKPIDVSYFNQNMTVKELAMRIITEAQQIIQTENEYPIGFEHNPEPYTDTINGLMSQKPFSNPSGSFRVCSQIYDSSTKSFTIDYLSTQHKLLASQKTDSVQVGNISTLVEEFDVLLNDGLLGDVGIP